MKEHQSELEKLKNEMRKVISNTKSKTRRNIRVNKHSNSTLSEKKSVTSLNLSSPFYTLQRTSSLTSKYLKIF